MSEKWSTIEELQNYFKIDVTDQDLLIKTLKEKRNELHPDKTGGQFNSESEKNEYLDIKEAIQFVKDEFNTTQQLVPISQISTLIKTISSELAMKGEPSIIESQKSLKSEFQTELSQKYKGFKIGSSIFAGISAYLFTQAGTLSEHPILSELFSTDAGLVGISTIFLMSATMFLFTWTQEKNLKSKIEYLLTDNASRSIYKELQETGKLFSVREIENILSNNRGSTQIFNYINQIDSITLNKIAKFQISKLLNKDLIIEIDKKGFDEVFTLK